MDDQQLSPAKRLKNRGYHLTPSCSSTCNPESPPSTVPLASRDRKSWCHPWLRNIIWFTDNEGSTIIFWAAETDQSSLPLTCRWLSMLLWGRLTVWGEIWNGYCKVCMNYQVRAAVIEEENKNNRIVGNKIRLNKNNTYLNVESPK